MKISEIKKFVATDRMVNVALIDGGSKDGYLSIDRVAVGPHVTADSPRRTVVRVKGLRGRPATVVPENIEAITWHPAAHVEVVTPKRVAVPTDDPKVTKVTKEVTPKGGPDRTAQADIRRQTEAVVAKEGLWCVKCGKKGVTLTVVNDGPKRHLYCKDCKPVTKAAGKSGQKVGDFTVTLNEDGSLDIRCDNSPVFLFPTATNRVQVTKVRR